MLEWKAFPGKKIKTTQCAWHRINNRIKTVLVDLIPTCITINSSCNRLKLMCQCRDKICINHSHKNTFIDFINEVIKRSLEEVYNYFSRFGKLICSNSFNIWPDTRKRHLYQNHYYNNRSLKERSSVDHFSKASHCVLLLGFCSVKLFFYPKNRNGTPSL